MTDYSLLNLIDSPILNSIYESKDFEEVENEKLIFFKKYSFSEIYQKIVDLKNGKLDFWKTKENLNLPDYLNSFLVDFYISKYVQYKDEKFWLETKNTKFLEYSFTHHFNEDFMFSYHDKISKLFGDKWVIEKTVQNSEYHTLLNYPNLRSLTIRTSSSFKEIPVLPNLLYLDASYNFHRITSFEHFPILPNLKELDVMGNQISSFEHFPILPNLEKLVVRDNQISSFEHFPILPNLEKLTIANNRITSFEHFPNLPNLEKLDISLNRFTSFKHFPILPNLKELDTSFNKFIYLDNFPILLNLEKLNISYDRLTSFKHFPILPNLKELDASFNQITSFEHFPILPKLKKLNTKYNKINYVNNNLNLNKPFEFEIHNNLITTSVKDICALCVIC